MLKKQKLQKQKKFTGICVPCDNASKKHIPFGCAGMVAGIFIPSHGKIYDISVS